MAAVIRHGGACNVEWPRLPPMMATCTPYFPSRCYCGGGGGSGGGGGGGGGMSRAVPCAWTAAATLTSPNRGGRNLVPKGRWNPLFLQILRPLTNAVTCICLLHVSVVILIKSGCPSPSCPTRSEMGRNETRIAKEHDAVRLCRRRCWQAGRSCTSKQHITILTFNPVIPSAFATSAELHGPSNSLGGECTAR